MEFEITDVVTNDASIRDNIRYHGGDRNLSPYGELLFLPCDFGCHDVDTVYDGAETDRMVYAGEVSETRRISGT